MVSDSKEDLGRILNKINKARNLFDILSFHQISLKKFELQSLNKEKILKYINKAQKIVNEFEKKELEKWEKMF